MRRAFVDLDVGGKPGTATPISIRLEECIVESLTHKPFLFKSLPSLLRDDNAQAALSPKQLDPRK